jgi:hypothetical protein
VAAKAPARTPAYRAAAAGFAALPSRTHLLAAAAAEAGAAEEATRGAERAAWEAERAADLFYGAAWPQVIFIGRLAAGVVMLAASVRTVRTLKP